MSSNQCKQHVVRTLEDSSGKNESSATSSFDWLKTRSNCFWGSLTSISVNHIRCSCIVYALPSLLLASEQPLLHHLFGSGWPTYEDEITRHPHRGVGFSRTRYLVIGSERVKPAEPHGSWYYLATESTWKLWGGFKSGMWKLSGWLAAGTTSGNLPTEWVVPDEPAIGLSITHICVTSI